MNLSLSLNFFYLAGWLLGVACDIEWLVGMACDMVGAVCVTIWLLGVACDIGWLVVYRSHLHTPQICYSS